jgi:tRNA (guanosine-2'-O-)-methyltransferase
MPLPPSFPAAVANGASVFPSIVRCLLPYVLPRRADKVRALLSHRLRDTTVVLENLRDPHNVGAILRTLDALGVSNVHVISAFGETGPLRFQPQQGEGGGGGGGGAGSASSSSPSSPASSATDAGAAKWLAIHHHASTQACLDALKADGHLIFASDLAPGALPVARACERAVEERTGLWRPRPGNSPPTRPRVALVFGNEHRGVSRLAARLADDRFFLPQAGFTQSLNVSVAAALGTHQFLNRTPDYAEWALRAHEARLAMVEAGAAKGPAAPESGRIRRGGGKEDEGSAAAAVAAAAAAAAPPSAHPASSCEGLPAEEYEALFARWLLADVVSAPAILRRAGIRPEEY